VVLPVFKTGRYRRYRWWAGFDSQALPPSSINVFREETREMASIPAANPNIGDADKCRRLTTSAD